MLFFQESNSIPGRVQCSEAAARLLLHQARFQINDFKFFFLDTFTILGSVTQAPAILLEDRGEIEVKKSARFLHV